MHHKDFWTYAITVLLLLALNGCDYKAGQDVGTFAKLCAQLQVPSNISLEYRPRPIAASGLQPAYCQVRGQIDGRTRFEMRLPEKWNARFMMAGCGGFCGSLLPDKSGHSNSINPALRRGYAAISHDGGHQAESWDTRWAYSDPEAFELWAHKVLPVVSDTGHALIGALYGKKARYSYFSGCSNGGRLGLVAVQRYPDLFDGIAAGCSIFDLSGNAGLWGNWVIRHAQTAAGPLLSGEELALVKQAVLDQCDALDGASDSVVIEPRACKVDFDELICPNHIESRECLSKSQHDMLLRLYGGVLTESGEWVYHGMSYGSEHYSDIWLFGSEEQPGWGALAASGYRQLLSNELLGKESETALSTDIMLEWIAKSRIPGITDAKNPDLSALRRAGTKLLIYQGWADPLILPKANIDYYERAASLAGGISRLTDHARLFMVPAMGHCWEKEAEGPVLFDPLLELEPWVESGVAPDSILLRSVDKARRTADSRSACAYPAVAQLTSGSDASSADSYQCVSGIRGTGNGAMP